MIRSNRRDPRLDERRRPVASGVSPRKSLARRLGAAPDDDARRAHATRTRPSPYAPRARLPDLEVHASSSRAPLRDASSPERERGENSRLVGVRERAAVVERRETRRARHHAAERTHRALPEAVRALPRRRVRLLPPPNRASVVALRVRAAPRPVFRRDTAAAAKQPESDGRFPPSPPFAGTAAGWTTMRRSARRRRASRTSAARWRRSSSASRRSSTPRSATRRR